ncbi:hypothetical protein O0J73_07215 [Stenotrophomonas sp. Sm6012]|uniref:hypothetical protein n=1 Tax=Stenotrophomonas sp. Sm6012 TaxID=3002745 RepID=UPI0027E46A95|nr:hypothetical protein [Stenotrophomonas sp. Sm6012]MDQ7280521.1 hypothetical protein [Stenotrophomonas sp. Sm6012]
MAWVRGVAVLFALGLTVGCANKQVLRNQAVMSKKLGATTTGLEQLAGSAVRDRRVSALMAFTPPDETARNEFLAFACDGDMAEFSVGQAIGTYRRRLTELDNLATAPPDTSFSALVASMKRSSAARKDLPQDRAQAMTAFDEAQKKAKVASHLSVRRCRAIVAHDLSSSADRIPGDRSYQSMGMGLDTYLTLINFLRTGMTLAEQTKRASIVRDYTQKVAQPDFELAHAYLATEPNLDPIAETIAGRNPLADVPPQACHAQKAFMDPAGKDPVPPATGKNLANQLGNDMTLGFGQPHGRLSLLTAQARATAVRQAFIHYTAAKLLHPQAGAGALSAVQNEAVLRSAADAADAMARADGLISIDVDCEVLPKLASSQQALSKAVIEGTSSADAADGFADALTNLQSILEALDKMKKAGW